MSAFFGKRVNIFSGTIVLALAGVLAIPLLSSLSNLSKSDYFAGVQHRPSVLWLSHLVGEQITLPSQDDQGFPLDDARPYFVISTDCIGCSKPGTFLNLVEGATLKPVLLLYDGDIDSVPDGLKEIQQSVLLIGRDSLRDPVLQELAFSAPQCARIEANGRISSVPNDREDITHFVRRKI